MHRFLLAASVCASLGLAALPVFAGDQTVDFADDHVGMSQAQTTAATTLDRFLAHTVDANGRAVETADIKVAFDVKNAGGASHEVIWVTAFIQDGDQFRGKLSNEPNAMPGLHLGDMVEFSRDQVRDWGWYDATAGKLYGHYTTRVIVKELPAEQAAQIQALLSADPVPSGW